MATGNPQPPFDENAALQELERLREEIRLARAHRERKIEEFEAWVRTNRNSARAERIAAIESEAAAASPARGARAATRASQPAAQSSAATASSPPPAERFEAARASLDRPRSFDPWGVWNRLRFTRQTGYYVGGAAIVIGALAVARPWSSGNSAPPQAEATASGGGAVPADPPAVGSSAPTGASAQPAAPRRPLEIELTTTRTVWMRVTVDGERRVEREIPSGQRLTFGADRAIVLRVGDGGAVRLSVRGRDEGRLGEDGQIAVRTLTAKQP